MFVIFIFIEDLMDKSCGVKKHLEKEIQSELIIPERLFTETIENKKLYNPKSLKQIATEKNKLDDKQLNKKLAKKMIISYYFTDRAMRLGFNITLENHHTNHSSSALTITPN